MVAFYIVITNITKSGIVIDYFRRKKPSFMIIGSNSSLHPAHIHHCGWAIGLAWGISEASVFFGSQILTQWNGFANDSVIFPDFSSQCGRFSYSFPFLSPIPIVFTVSVMWLCVFVVNCTLTFVTIVQRENQRYCVPFSMFLNLVIHFGLYLSVYFSQSSAYFNDDIDCYKGIYVPVIYTICTLIYCWLVCRTFFKPDPKVHKTDTSFSNHARHQRRQYQQLINDDEGLGLQYRNENGSRYLFPSDQIHSQDDFGLGQNGDDQNNYKNDKKNQNNHLDEPLLSINSRQSSMHQTAEANPPSEIEFARRKHINSSP
jgi:hypothetical protein